MSFSIKNPEIKTKISILNGRTLLGFTIGISALKIIVGCTELK